ncbi:MAG: hypothetical protein KDD67_01225 [Ignavibacteriae bacterium]|nr:hypothetical protein [Ignavibacteriota bacterium]MCB9217658.1 hypothetical protein [Ignavibacteria bacterium]
MSRFNITGNPFPLFLLLTVGLISGCSCEDEGITDPDPDYGSGNLLQSSLLVNGRFKEPVHYYEHVRFALDAERTFYDAEKKRGEIVGTLSGDTLRTLKLWFEHDLEKGTFPVTFSGVVPLPAEEQRIFYTEQVNGEEKWYLCDLDSCRITLTGSDGKIVAGNFSAYMVGNVGGAILLGDFSVRFSQ